MNPREVLRRLVEDLPEADLAAAERLLRALRDGEIAGEALLAEVARRSARGARAAVAWGGIADWPTPEELAGGKGGER